MKASRLTEQRGNNPMFRSTNFILVQFFGSISLLCCHCFGQDASDPKSFVESAREYHFRSGQQGEMDFELRQKPVMVWSNPATYDQKGAVFVWMKEGRPMVLGTLFDSVHSGQPRSSIELLSLSDTEIIGRTDDADFWHPLQSGLKWASHSGTAEIGITSQRRLLQMRPISREFAATLTNQDNSKLQLRLLPTPILTYEPRNDVATEGAIFAFAATGTDPDVLLLIENRVASGKHVFHFAFARFDFRELIAIRGKEEIWRADPKVGMTGNFIGSPSFRDSPYVFFRVK